MMKRLKFFTLAALLVLPLAACDEGEDVVAPVSGSIGGTVTIDGAGASGVTVALSSGATTTTDGSGQYTFDDVAQGAYSVTISGFPTDVTFPATSKAVVISGAGVQTVDFSGTSIRTSAISGSVTSGGDDLEGVTVTLSGDGTGSATTDANGDYSFSGIGAGSYTVTLSGLPDGVTCAETSQTVTVGTGEVQVVNFTCNPSGAGVISGQLYVDGNENDVRDTGEETLEAGNVTISLEGPDIGETRTTVTNEDGTYSFTDLVSGSYNVCIDDEDGDIPDNVEYGGASECFTRTLSGGGATVDFPFDILQQTVIVGAFLGTEDDPRIEPVEGVVIELYPTEADLNAQTNILGTDTTDADGDATFVFDRDDDTSPGGDDADQIVFARVDDAPTFYEAQGPSQMEIHYDPLTAVYEDGTFTFLNTEIVFGFHALTTETGDPLEDWNAAVWLNDTTAVALDSEQTDSTGFVTFRDAVAAASLPDTFFMRLSGAQPEAFGHAFEQDAEGEAGEAVNVRWLRIVHDGLHGDTVDVGNEIVSFFTSDLLVRTYHEADDTAWLSMGDDFQNVDNLQVTLWLDGDVVETKTPQVADGSVTFTGLETNAGDYMVTASSTVDQQEIITDTTVAVQVLNGSNPAVYECPLGADTLGTAASCATFAYKYNNGGVIATVQTADNTPVEGATVRIQSLPRLLGEETDTTLITDEDGQVEVIDLIEGPYEASVLDSITAEGDTLWTVVAPNNRADTFDIENNEDVDLPVLTVTRHDTEIHGVVVNDRDADQNVIDPGEALEGVQLNLYRNDTLIATTETNAEGEYTFAGLLEGVYRVEAETTGDAQVLRGFDDNGQPIDTLTAQTSGAPLVRGTHDPVPLPRWDYDDSEAQFVGDTHFTFLYSNTEARGEVVDQITGEPVSGVVVTLQRCDESPESGDPGAAESPPQPGNCTSDFPGFVPQTATTDANGDFSFTGLQEGVYEVDAGGGTVPDTYLYLLVGSGDIESATFEQP